MLLGVVYLLIAVTCTGLIEQGWSKWLYLVFFLALWNALKFILFGPWSLVFLHGQGFRQTELESLRPDSPL